jgi:cellulose biosynthesis protein BcsQ
LTKVISIANQKGSVGKITTTIHFGVGLDHAGSEEYMLIGVTLKKLKKL